MSYTEVINEKNKEINEIREHIIINLIFLINIKNDILENFQFKDKPYKIIGTGGFVGTINEIYINEEFFICMDTLGNIYNHNISSFSTEDLAYMLDELLNKLDEIKSHKK